MLHFPQNHAKLFLTADASNVACGAVLEQLVETDGVSERQPLGFYSEKFDATKLKWPTIDKELYAIYSAVDHFSYLIEGRELLMFTDHKPLIHIFKTKHRIKLERLSRLVEFISQYSTNIQHISGISNVIADTLSHLRPKVK